jgi:hypothetical protein
LIYLLDTDSPCSLSHGSTVSRKLVNHPRVKQHREVKSARMKDAKTTFLAWQEGRGRDRDMCYIMRNLQESLAPGLLHPLTMGKGKYRG